MLTYAHITTIQALARHLEILPLVHIRHKQKRVLLAAIMALAGLLLSRQNFLLMPQTLHGWKAMNFMFQMLLQILQQHCSAAHRQEARLAALIFVPQMLKERARLLQEALLTAAHRMAHGQNM